jgi:hypothetical protein
MSRCFNFGRGFASAHIVPIFLENAAPTPVHFDTLSATFPKWQVSLSVDGCDVCPRKCSFENDLGFSPVRKAVPLFANMVWYNSRH